MNTVTKRLLTAGLITLIPAWCFAEQKDLSYTFGLKPSIVQQDDGNGYTGGLEINANAEYAPSEGSDTITYRKDARAELRAEGLLTGDKEHNPRPLRAEVIAGGSLYLSGPKLSELGPNPGEEIVTQKAFDHGMLSFGLNAGYETDQAFDHQNATVGGELAYVLIQNEGWKALVPSVYAQYEWVEVEKSELQRSANIDDKGYQRYRASASWKMPVGDLLPTALQPLQLHLDARYYKDLGRPEAIEQAGLDESQYVAGALSYIFRRPMIREAVSGVFVKVSRGRIPPALDNATDAYLGLVLWEK